MRKIVEGSLYLVITEEHGGGRTALEIARCAIAGGVDVIQMREKEKGRDELVRLGKAMARLCKEEGATFIVNDDPHVAKEAGADGVHLGQEDMLNYPLEKTKRVLGRDGIIGVSTHSIEEFIKANESDADYIAFGPIFPTKTKDYFLGIKDIKKVLGLAEKPVFFIGGIDLTNIDQVLSEGAGNIALIRGITEAEDIAAVAAALKGRLRNEAVKRGR